MENQPPGQQLRMIFWFLGFRLASLGFELAPKLEPHGKNPPWQSTRPAPTDNEPEWRRRVLNFFVIRVMERFAAFVTCCEDLDVLFGSWLGCGRGCG
jgi:hypothetical protein